MHSADAKDAAAQRGKSVKNRSTLTAATVAALAAAVAATVAAVPTTAVAAATAAAAEATAATAAAGGLGLVHTDVAALRVDERRGQGDPRRNAGMSYE